ICHLAFKNDSSDAEFCKNVFMCWEARLVLPFQLVLRKWRSEVSEGRMAAHRKLDQRRACRCAVALRKRACAIARTSAFARSSIPELGDGIHSRFFTTHSKGPYTQAG